MADRESRFVVAFDGQAGDLNAVLNSIKGQFRSAVSEIEAVTRKVSLFSDLETRTKASAEALFDASAKAKILAAELEKIKAVGGKATDDLTRGLREANREVTTATNAYNRNVDALTKMQRQLSAAGVDTSNLARAQLKLAEAHKIAAAAQDQQAAKQLLGVKTLADIQPQIQKLNAAYLTLKDSGTLSAKELSIAHGALTGRIKETNAQVTTLSGGLKGAGTEFSTFLSGAATRFIGITALLTGAIAGINAAIDASKAFSQSLAEIGTVTNLTRAQLDQLGAGARVLATTIGFDLTAGMKALFEIIRSGVPADNALEVLRISAEAAKASLTDIGTASRVSTLLIDGFGLGVEDLRLAFDKLIQGSKDGGATLKEFAESAGPLLNVARDARIPFDELVATLTVMTDASNDAQGSIGALTKIVIRLGDSDVRRKLADLGITTTNLVDVFTQLGKQDKTINDVIDLGIASTKTAAGVAALTNNAAKLAPELDKIEKSAGVAAKAAASLYDSPAERSARFNAALHETSTQFGLLIGSGSRLATVGTAVLRPFNELAATFTKNGIASGLLNNSMFGLVARMFGMVPAAEAVVTAADETDAALKRASAEAADTSAELKTANITLGDSATKLLAEVQALQAVSTRDIGDVQARADAQIAALDRTGKAAADTAAATITIQTKLAADRLAIIQKNENAVLAAINFAAAARVSTEKKLSDDTLKAQLSALAPILAQYQAHYNALVGLAQGHLAKISSIEQERVDFNRGVEKTLSDLRLGGLSALDQYAAKVKEIDKLISDARTAGVNGDIAKAKQFTDQAIALSLTVKKVVTEDGREIIGQFTAQQTSLGLIKKASDGYNESLGEQDDLAKAGLVETQKGLDAVVPKITELQTRYDSLKASIAEGLHVQVDLDKTSVADSLAAINELTKPRTVVITAQTVQDQSAGGPIVAPVFRRGGQVGRVIEAAQRFASGGAVFRRPTWNKVPGIGNADTVPAALKSGSFVLRKAASLFYGDSLLGRLARGFAGGGSVQAPPNENFWVKYRDTIEKLRALQQASRLSIPGRQGDTTLGTFAAGLVENFVFFSEPHREQIRKLIDESFEGWFSGIGVAKQFHVPNVVDFSLLGLLKRYAGGGTTDTVPAMLTPGEQVIRPERVGEFGTGFMHALNSMRVSRETLAAMLYPQAPRPPVARFATGGLVAGSTASQAGRSASGTAAPITINVTAAAGALLSEDNVRRFIVPVLNDINRRST